MSKKKLTLLRLTTLGALTLQGCGSSSSTTFTPASTPPGITGKSWMDVHGAGAQRSDLKEGNPADFPQGHGPQGDAIRIYNYVRLVRGDSSAANSYPVVDTGQTASFNANAKLNQAPTLGQPFFGQDANYSGLQPSYTNNGNGTISDNNTGLIWIRESGAKMTHANAAAGASTCRVGGYSDWRLPTIKELYSLMSFAGADMPGFAPGQVDKTRLIPFINTNYFTFIYGPDTSATAINDRLIDAQYASATECVSDRDLMKRAFGLNLADGRIKAYPTDTVTSAQGSWTIPPTPFALSFCLPSTQFC